MWRTCRYCREKFKAVNKRQAFCCATHRKRFAAKGRSRAGGPIVKGCPKGDYMYTKINALIALAKIQRQDKDGHHECRYYWCSEHSGYHLTSKN